MAWLPAAVALVSVTYLLTRPYLPTKPDPPRLPRALLVDFFLQRNCKETGQKESEWAWGVVTADGGNAPLGLGPAVSPPPPSRPRATTPFPNHINTPHTTLVASIHS